METTIYDPASIDVLVACYELLKNERPLHQQELENLWASVAHLLINETPNYNNVELIKAVIHDAVDHAAELDVAAEVSVRLLEWLQAKLARMETEMS